MVHYNGYSFSFDKVPDEASICFELIDDGTSKDLENDLPRILDDHKDSTTCVCFIGEGGDPYALGKCILLAKLAGFKTCLYSDRNDVNIAYNYNLDYIKTNDSNNMRFSQIKHFPVDMTYRFKGRNI